MRSAQHLAVRVALFGTVLLAAGCFRPKILPGSFFCGDGGACPDGYVCDFNQSPRVCVQTLSDGGAGKGGAGGKGGQGGQAGRDAGVDHSCLAPVGNANCPADAGAGLCDPVCNTGCGSCTDKCSVNTEGTLTCNPLGPPGAPTVGLLQYCQQESPQDKSMQTDNCAPGQVCLSASLCPLPRCYQFCRTGTDCSNGASCSRDAGGGNKFCDVPMVVCNPLPGATTGCGSSNIGCYLSGTSLNTLCDCQFQRSDNKNGILRDPCTHSRDCLPGYVCTNPTGTGGQCYPVCMLPQDGGTTTSTCAGACMPLSASNTVYGFCNL